MSVASRDIADIWAGHDSERLSWAFRAYASFVDSLSAEIRERLAHQDHRAEAYVVVFGKTQVGKTTLLMDLMGVLPTQMARVAQVLRGGRRQGQSATATTMEYRRSADRRWGLRLDGADTAWYADDQAMTLALGQLRTAMEARQLTVSAPCVVFVPCDCFDAQASAPAVRMLDLPGDSPANATEQEHVHAMARRYVPLADLILLVGRGDDLSFLQGGGLALPGIEDWQSAPRRFRIVTTYSFTPQSVRQLVREQQGAADIALFRQRLIAQIEKSISLSDAARRPQHFFPLEFGLSWLDAKDAQPQLYQRVAPMVDALKRQLLDDIHASTTPLARLRAAVETHVVIARVKEQRLKKMQESSTALQTQLAQLHADQHAAQQAARLERKHGEQLQERLAVLSDARLRRDMGNHFRVSSAVAEGDPGENVPGFKMLVRQAKSSLAQFAASGRPDTAAMGDSAWLWRSVQASPDAQRVDTALTHAFSDFSDTLDGYVLDTYWFTGSDSDYQRDIKTLASCIQQARASVTDLARQSWLSAGQARLLEHRRELKQSQLKLLSWQQMVDGGLQPIRHLEHTLAVQAQQRQAFEKRMEADMAESRGFTKLLDTHYLSELQQRRQQIMADEQPVSAFLGLLAAVQLEQVRQQVLLHTESADA